MTGKKELMLAFGAFFFMSLHALAGSVVSEQEIMEAEPVEKDLKPLLIQQKSIDVTGDKKKDQVDLYGTPFEEKSPFFTNVEATITIPESASQKIQYEDGYEPKIVFEDLNHDGVKDLFYFSATGGSGGFYNYQLDTLKGGEVTNIPLPESPIIEGQFLDGYKASIKIPGLEEIIVDLSSRSEDYNRLGLYQDGKLNEPTELMVNPTSFYQIVKIKGYRGKGLKGYQSVNGAYQADNIGTVETKYYYDKGKWIVIESVWVPAPSVK